jgi:heme-degrading monooxygenase HmoA
VQREASVDARSVCAFRSAQSLPETSRYDPGGSKVALGARKNETRCAHQRSRREENIMVVTVFRARLRPGVEAAIGPLAARMLELGRAQPGFVSYKDFYAPDGEMVSIVEFETLEDSANWRDVAEHRAVQEQAKASYFSEYSVQVCELVRESRSSKRT